MTISKDIDRVRVQAIRIVAVLKSGKIPTKDGVNHKIAIIMDDKTIKLTIPLEKINKLSHEELQTFVEDLMLERKTSETKDE